jgi:DinB family protein
VEPAVLRRELAYGLEIVRQLVAGVSQVEARLKPTPETWSILEVLAHLYDEEREDFRPRLDIALHRPEEKWQKIDPAGWVTTRKYNDRDIVQTLDGLLIEREKSLTWLHGLSEPNWDAEYPAPFGLIKAGDLLASWVAHDNLHTRQLVELKRSRVLGLVAPYRVQYAGDW